MNCRVLKIFLTCVLFGHVLHLPSRGQLPGRKVGLAPHERPSCQLPPISVRRHSQAAASGSGEGAQVRPANGTLGAPGNSSSSGLSLVPPAPDSPAPGSDLLAAPSVVSLNLVDQQAGKAAAAAGGEPALAGAQAGRKSGSSERLRQLRHLLASNSYDAYLVTANDEHGSELVAEPDKRLRFISGFGGPQGFALVLLDRAILFTEARFAAQAEQELDCNWWLAATGDEPLAELVAWLRSNSGRGLKIATDARLMALPSYEYLEEHLKRHLDSELALISQDLVDVVWQSVEPAGKLVASEPLFVHPLQFAGNQSWQEKTIRLADGMARLGASQYIISRLDDIAWLLNLRGSDIPMAPLFKAYLFVWRSEAGAGGGGQLAPPRGPRQPPADGLQAPAVTQLPLHQSIRLTLFVDPKKVDQRCREHLHTDNGSSVLHYARPPGADWAAGEQAPRQVSSRIHLELKDYELFVMELRERMARRAEGPSAPASGRLLLEADSNVAVHVLARKHEDRLVLAEGLVSQLKALKSEPEVQGMRAAQLRDSLAVCMLLARLAADVGHRRLTGRWSEAGAAQELELYRSLMEHSRGPAMEPVSAYGPSAGQLPHRRPERARLIGNQSTYLLATAGQYLDGTTGVARTLHFGAPSELQREVYTRVLMGSIDLMSLVAEAAPGAPVSDLLARRHLLEAGLDYPHPTSHGVGLYSLARERPAFIESHWAGGRRARSRADERQLRPPAAGQPPLLDRPLGLAAANMFGSVGPGFYRAHEFGVRLEDVVVSQRTGTGSPRPLLRLEPVSLVPYEPKLIKLALLSNRQKAWLNSYNLMVRLRLTQQINYYLAKVRSHRLPGAAARPLAKRGVPDQPDSPAGLTNFLRLEPAQLEELLERTHRWILASTELVALDVPRSLAAGALRSELEPVAGSQASRQHSEAERVEAQKLMLFYMSSQPFNDAAALGALSRLSARSDAGSPPPPPAPGNASAAAAVDAGRPRKCTRAGYQCDLILAEAINSPLAGDTRPLRSPALPLPEWPAADLDLEPAPEAGFEPHLPADYDSLGPLGDLFQLSSSAQGDRRAPISANMWLALVALASLVGLQLALVKLACRAGKRRRGSLALSARARPPAAAASHQPLQQLASQRPPEAYE